MSDQHLTQPSPKEHWSKRFDRWLETRPDLKHAGSIAQLEEFIRLHPEDAD